MNKIRSLCKEINVADRILLLLYILSAIAIEGAFRTVTLHGVIPIVILVVFMQKNRILFNDRNLKIYLLLTIWMVITCFTALDVDLAWSGMEKRILAFLCSIVTFHLAQKKQNIPFLYLAIIFQFIILMLYAYNNIGLLIAERQGDRLQDDTINANKFAYTLFYATFALYMLQDFLFKETSQKIEILKAVALIVLSGWLSLMTASRQVLLIQIPLIIGLYFLKTSKKIKVKSVFRSFVVLIVLYFLLSPIFFSYYNNSLLAYRSEGMIVEDSRFEILKDAISKSLDYPIMGVGPANFTLISKGHIFTHNCFAEILTNSGYPALGLYLSLVLGHLLIQIKRYKRYKDQYFLNFCWFELLFIIDNFLYVHINSLWLMSFYFIIIGHSELYYKINYKNK